jgi:hypothetical protein
MQLAAAAAALSTAFLENCQQAPYPRPPEGTQVTLPVATAWSGGPRAYLPEPANILPRASSDTELEQQE